MKRFSIIIPVALATIVAGCSKDVETEKKPSGDPWIYDESLPVPIQFGASGLDVKVKSAFNDPEDLTGEKLGVLALDMESGWADEYGVKDSDAICLDDEVVTCAFDESKNRYMLDFEQARYYPYKSDRNFSFFAYYKGENPNALVYDAESVKVPVSGEQWGNQDVIWARSDAQTLYVKNSEEINPETGDPWGYIPAEQGVDATAFYNGFNASYVRYIAKPKPKGSIDHSYAKHLPTLNFEHKTTCIRFIARLDDAVVADVDFVPVVESVEISGEEIYTGADFTIVHKDDQLQGTFDMSQYPKGTVLLRNDEGSAELNVVPTNEGAQLGNGYFFQPISKDSPISLTVTINGGNGQEKISLNIDSHAAFKAGYYYTYEIRIYKNVGMEVAVVSVSPWLNGWEDAQENPGQLGGDDLPDVVL